MPAPTTGPQLHKHFPPGPEANESERDQLIGILELCGVLRTSAHSGFFERFVSTRDRTLHSHHNADMAHPACGWRGADGINQQRLSELFVHVL